MRIREGEGYLSSFPYPLYFLSMTIRNADHKIIYAWLTSPPPKSSSPLKWKHRFLSWSTILSISIEVRIFHHGGKDAVAGRTGSIGVPEGKIHSLPIPLIPHLTDNEAGIINTVDCVSFPTQGVDRPPLQVEVQQPNGLFLVQGKVEAHHGENRRVHIDILLLLRILAVFSYFPSFVFWRIRLIVRFGRRLILLELTIPSK